MGFFSGPDIITFIYTQVKFKITTKEIRRFSIQTYSAILLSILIRLNKAGGHDDRTFNDCDMTICQNEKQKLKK